MIRLSRKQQKIIAIILRKGAMQSSDIYSEMIKLGEDISLVMIKRTLSEMTGEDFLIFAGSGRSTNYNISSVGRMLADIDAKEYCSVEPDKRYGLTRYNFDLFAALPMGIFTDDESKILNEATAEHETRTKNLPPAIQKKIRAAYY